MRFRYGGRTDVGTTRMVNEDAFRIDAERGLVAVVDGVGGISSGEVAAAIACDVAAGLVTRSAEEGPPCWPFPPDPLHSDGENLLVTATRLANNRILTRSMADPALRGMGAAVVFALFDASADLVSMAHVGDAEALRLRRGTLSPLLRPHTLVNEMGWALSTEGRAELARQYSNVITRAVGVVDDVHVDSSSWPIDPGDVYVLCTDGLTGELDAPTIERIVATESDPERAAHALVEATLAAGARDNVTVVVVSCRA